MTNLDDFSSITTYAREASQPPEPACLFSVCSVVNDYNHYDHMLESFNRGGFSPDTTEFLYIDNSQENKYDCYQGLNKLINQCQGKYIIMCHQDVRLIEHNQQTLLERLTELDRQHPSWGLCGNAGKTAKGRFRVRIADLNGSDQLRGPLPAEVVSLDENFIVMKREACLACALDISGFHIYATDLCLQANVRGWKVYVIDFHLEHLGKGVVDQHFYNCATQVENKYQKVFRRRRIKTPCTRFVVGASKLEHWFRLVGHRWGFVRR